MERANHLESNLQQPRLLLLHGYYDTPGVWWKKLHHKKRPFQVGVANWRHAHDHLETALLKATGVYQPPIDYLMANGIVKKETIGDSWAWCMWVGPSKP